MNLLEHLKQRDKMKQAKTKDPKMQHTPLGGEKQSEASFGSLILLSRLQLLFEESWDFFKLR